MNSKLVLTLTLPTSVFVGILAFASSARAAIVGTTTTNCDFSGATICTNVLTGNDNAADLNSVDDLPFSNVDWSLLSRINAPNTAPDTGVNPSFTLSDPSGSTSGTWSALQSVIGSGNPFVLVMKASNRYAYNYFDGTVFNGTWDTDRFLNNGGRPQNLSHATLYVADNAPAIPTPAMLPGLIGLGFGVVRKRMKKQEMAQSSC